MHIIFIFVTIFLGYIFRGFPPGTEIIKKDQEVELWRSYIFRTILLRIAP